MSFADYKPKGGRSRELESANQPLSSYQGYQQSTSSDFIRNSQSAVNNLQKMKAAVNSMRKAEPRIGTKKDTAELRSGLARSREEVTALARETTALLRSLQVGGAGPPQQRAQQQKLAKEFQCVLRDYKSASRSTAEQERVSVAAARQQAGGGLGAVQTSERQSLMSQKQMLQADVAISEEVVRAREREIKQIETSIVEVTEIFQDLAVIVQGQGEQIDTISTNVDHTHDSTNAALYELQYAAEKQRENRTCICCLLLILATLVLLVLFFLVPDQVGVPPAGRPT